MSGYRQYPLSCRSDDGRARLNVNALVNELETSMKSKGGNHMNITGMNLTIIKTLMNHINMLQDRIEELEGEVACSRSMERESEKVIRHPRYEDDRE